MNKTKRNLILSAAIIEMIIAIFMLFAAILFLSVSSEIFEEAISKYVEDVSTFNFEVFRLAFIIISSIEFGLYTIASALLLNSIRAKGTMFAKSKKSYIAGVVITIILEVISIQSILIYCSLGIKDEAKPQEVKLENKPAEKVTKEVRVIEIKGNQSTITKTIIGYKTLKDQGVITETEYKGMVIRYLRELKESGKITADQFDQLLTKVI